MRSSGCQSALAARAYAWYQLPVALWTSLTDRSRSLDYSRPSLLQLCSHVKTWNSTRAKWLHGSEWQKPAVTWISSCVWYNTDSVAKGTFLSSPPSTRPTEPPALPPPHSFLPSGLLHESYSSAQCWNMAGTTDIWWQCCPHTHTTTHTHTHKLTHHTMCTQGLVWAER